MKIYAVGGAIRDTLMGLPMNDVDYVVVGSSVEEMLSKGFRPVGKDFPVFLHPQTQAEYALARTERKTGKGYKGFLFHADPSVTLEEDLERRDLTINAMAQEISENGVKEILPKKSFVMCLLLFLKTHYVYFGLRALLRASLNLLSLMKL